ncbi:MAG: hypothetical protein Q9168_002969 [Polycauliona sp. 1 TL-2023]
MGPPTSPIGKADSLEKQRKDNAKRRKCEAKRSKKVQKRQLLVEGVVQEHQQLMIRRRTRHLVWLSFLVCNPTLRVASPQAKRCQDNTAEPDTGTLKWLTLENMHESIRGMWSNQNFRDTARQVHDLPLNVDSDRFIEIATLVTSVLLLQMQTMKSQGSSYAYHVAEIFLRLKYTLPKETSVTPLGKLKQGQTVVEDPLLLELSLKETESVQDVYLRVRDDLYKGVTSSAKTTEEILHDEILQLFQGLARLHCPHLRDHPDPLGAAHYLGFPKIKIPSLEGVKKVRFSGDVVDEGEFSDSGEEVWVTTTLEGWSNTSIAIGFDTDAVWLLAVGVLVLAILLYALASSSSS